ncbi:MAG: esterase [Lachnospiraceae bacterium]|nr:esterase [Lachnospiraceae bacterium]
MEKEIFRLDKKQCYFYIKEKPECIIIQPVEEDTVRVLGRQVELISQKSRSGFLYAAFKVDNWNDELSPWTADPVFGREGFKGGAHDTLDFILNELLPSALQKSGLKKAPVIIGGYSLAALFSLWCGYQTESFSAVAAASPSVWFPGWTNYINENTAKTHCIYLSLGDKEEKTKNRTMKAVGDNIRLQHQILAREGKETILKWNDGNHFKDIDIRCADAFTWCLESVL